MGVMAQSAPRLTGLLRSLAGAEACPREEALRDRRELLRKLRQGAGGEIGDDAGHGQPAQLQWRTFLGRGRQVEGLRKMFSEFVENCAELAGDEEAMIGERLETLAMTLYQGFNGPQGLKKPGVESLTGSRVKASTVKRARELAQRLHEWQFSEDGPKAQRERADPVKAASAAPVAAPTMYTVPEEKSAPMSLMSKGGFAESTSLEPGHDSSLALEEPLGVSTADGTGASLHDEPAPSPWEWIVEQCTLHVLKQDHQLMAPVDLANTIVSMLAGPSSDDELQGQLLDLLGLSEGTFELMAELISRRGILASAKPGQPKKSKNHGRTTNTAPSQGGRGTLPTFAPSSRSDDGPALLRTAKVDSKAAVERNAPRVALPNTNPGGRPAGTKEEHISHTRLSGPGTDGDEEKEENKGRYIQVVVPAPRRNNASDDYLVPISTFGPLAQQAFKGIPTLNRLQSAVFETAYFTNNNLLICAPTGAGKTNVAMTTVVREIETHADDLSAVKIIYVAPMKALAQEVVDKFSQRLKHMGVKVRELTGDMQLSRTEIEATHVIVTTPEKWDVITRKSGDGTLVEQVGLLIIDEVHLIGEDRGPVIESLVARTLRLVEQKQKMVRIVGLSATLPNYRDVARFLRVDLNNGLFFFDNRYRPVPLEQTFIGVIEKNIQKKLAMYNDIAFLKALESVQNGDQVMIFVHSRNDTSKTARALLEIARKTGNLFAFNSATATSKNARNFLGEKVSKSKNADVRELYESGIGIHHAGMQRSDRSLTEKLFSENAISVLCCTATLAWGVNLPVHTVIVKGTQIYVPEKGGLVELNMQDVFQCFGRAGRPQFDTSGEATLITEHDQLNRYLSMLNHALPLESQLDKRLPDALNAEIVSGTVTNLEEAVQWLSYTFLHIRMMMSPVRYGVSHKEKEEDPSLRKKRAEMIVAAARELDRAKMSRFALTRGPVSALGGRLHDMQAPFGVTDLGRVASHFYIGHATVEEFNARLKPEMTDAQVLDLLCHASEFDQLKLREEELKELGKLRNTACVVDLLAPIDSPRGKACVLLQTYISNVYVQTFTLASDMNYIAQNMGRVARAVFEICMKKRWSSMTETMLCICIALDRRCWWPPYSHPLRQVCPQLLPFEIVQKLEDRADSCHLENLVEMEPNEIGSMIRNVKFGARVAKSIRAIPYLSIDAHLQPLTRSILRVTVDVFPDFEWNDRMHGKVLNFWLWVDDQNSEWVYHTERFVLRKSDWRTAQRGKESEKGEEALNLKRNTHPALMSAALEANSCTRREFTIPIFEPLPPQYYLRIFCDSWHGSEAVVPLTLDKLVLPPKVKQHTDLLELTPLPRSALKAPLFEKMYEKRFTHFNPIQTQAFHTLYHTDHPVLLGAPTGSGKTISSELALLRVFREYPNSKTVYIAPLKALVSERVKEWKVTMEGQLGKRVVEFTGDVSPDPGILRRADILITTPEKWDGASRMWKRRDYVKDVRLVIIDEIHLLGEERGAVLEVLVTRMRYIAETTGNPVRIVGLSTALANAHDLGNWLGIKKDLGLFNFRPAVRPVPLEAHIHGFPGKHYCPRMATMNKPAFQAILTHSPAKPVLIFVASRRQTRLTALDLISLCAASENPRRFLHMEFEEMDYLVQNNVKDETLKHTLEFGIGIHHAGLDSRDRDLVENLFVSGKIQVLVCTSTLAWGVNFPAHLVVIKGTEYFDAKTKRYQPFPVTDVLQMMGRAGRPQFDKTGVAMIFVEESLKDFYKKFLYEPFPVESHLAEFLHNHLNAEIAAGSINNEREGLDYLSWTYFFRRLPMNPSYYGLKSNDPDDVAIFLVELVRQVLRDLERAGCVELHGGLAAGSALLNGEGASTNKQFADNWKTSESITSKADKEVLDRKIKNLRIVSTKLGKVASFYYLDYRTIEHFSAFFRDISSHVDPTQRSEMFRKIFELISGSHEFSEVPVRHNEDLLNADMGKLVPWDPFSSWTWASDSPHAKAFLLLQAHCKSLPMPHKDYVNDLKSVLDQTMRVANALVEIACHLGRLDVALITVQTAQCIVQGRFWDQPAISQVSRRSKSMETSKQNARPDTVTSVDSSLRSLVSSKSLKGDLRSLSSLPDIQLTLSKRAENDSQIKVSLGVVNSPQRQLPFRRYEKAKDHAWWIFVSSGDQVIHSQHMMGIPRNIAATFDLSSDQRAEQCQVYVLSGSVMGIDQQIVWE